MFPNWTGWKSIKALLFSLVTLNGVLMTANVFSVATMHDAMIASLFLGAAGTIVTTLSGTAMGPDMAKRIGAAACLVFALAGLAFQSACFGAGSIAPTADFAVCVATDALAKKSIADIVHDCGGDAAAVIASLATSGDPKVADTPAMAEAKRTRAALALFAADAGTP